MYVCYINNIMWNSLEKVDDSPHMERNDVHSKITNQTNRHAVMITGFFRNNDRNPSELTLPPITIEKLRKKKKEEWLNCLILKRDTSPKSTRTYMWIDGSTGSSDVEKLRWTDANWMVETFGWLAFRSHARVHQAQTKKKKSYRENDLIRLSIHV